MANDVRHEGDTRDQTPLNLRTYRTTPRQPAGAGASARGAFGWPAGLALAFAAYRFARVRSVRSPLGLAALVWAARRAWSMRDRLGRGPREAPSDRRIDEAVQQTFPASDPPALGPVS